MARSVEEWVGKSDDSKAPPSVRLRVWDRLKGRCHACGRKIGLGERWTLEHLIALINWLATPEQPHGNRESNLGLTCPNCLPAKNAADMAEKSTVADLRKAHILPKPLSTWGCGRGSKWKRKINGQTVPR